jgi:transposase
LNLTTREVIIRTDDTINAQSTIELFKEIEMKSPEAGNIHVITDNARYYKNKLVTAYLRSSKIKLLHLPPYSPNLNIIERLWLFFHRKILYNKYFETFTEFKQKSISFFENLSDFKPELDTLLTDKFQIIYPGFSKT